VDQESKSKDYSSRAGSEEQESIESRTAGQPGSNRSHGQGSCPAPAKVEKHHSEPPVRLALKESFSWRDRLPS
jgi:hypothetical protein